MTTKRLRFVVCAAALLAAYTYSPYLMAKGLITKETLKGPHEKRGTAYVDAGGLVYPGPAIGVEARWGHFSGVAYARLYYPLINFYEATYTRGEPGSPRGFGGGLGLRLYPLTPLRSLQAGVFVEYLRWGSVRNSNDGARRIVTKAGSLISYGELGYRFGARRFFVGPRVLLGYAFTIWSHPKRESSLFFAGSSDLGFYW